MTEALRQVAGFHRTRKWIDRLAAFFERRASALGHVLEAAGCREGWLHGEVHREFRVSAFSVPQLMRIAHVLGLLPAEIVEVALRAQDMPCQHGVPVVDHVAPKDEAKWLSVSAASLQTLIAPVLLQRGRKQSAKTKH